jgi:hypothetical protein
VNTDNFFIVDVLPPIDDFEFRQWYFFKSKVSSAAVFNAPH